MQEAINDMLNDLLIANNERIITYQGAIGQLNDQDCTLKALFQSMLEQSSYYKYELKKMIEKNGGLEDDNASLSGKIRHVWKDIKSTILDADRLTALAACLEEENATQRAYNSALSSDVIYFFVDRKVLEDERNALKKSHVIIKKQHDILEYL